METAPASIRNQILREAAHLFVQRGYDGISMREIAEACGLSKAGIYYHFTNKEDLFLALLKDNLTTLKMLFWIAVTQGGSCRETLTRFALSLFKNLGASERAVIRLANQEMSKLSPERREEFTGEYQRAFLQPLAETFETGMADGELRQRDAHLMVWVFLGMLYPFFSPSAETGPETIKAALDLFFEGANA